MSSNLHLPGFERTSSCLITSMCRCAFHYRQLQIRNLHWRSATRKPAMLMHPGHDAASIIAVMTQEYRALRRVSGASLNFGQVAAHLTAIAAGGAREPIAAGRSQFDRAGNTTAADAIGPLPIRHRCSVG